MRPSHLAALSLASSWLVAACSGKVDGANQGTPASSPEVPAEAGSMMSSGGSSGPASSSGSSGAGSSSGGGEQPPPSGQPLAYFYGNPVDGGAIYGVPAGGGTPVLLLSGNDIASHVAFDARNIYYDSEEANVPSSDGQSYSYSLHSIPIAGGPSTTLVSKVDGIGGIAVGATHVYFAVQTANTFDDAGIATAHGEIHSVPIGGGAEQVLGKAAGSLGGIAVDSAYVYWTATAYSGSAPGGSALKTPIAGGATQTLASGQRLPRQIAVDATGVYWMNYGTMQIDCSSTDGSISELAAGSMAPVTLVSPLKGAESLALRNGDVYWAEGGASCDGSGQQNPQGSVSRRTGATGATTILASAVETPQNLYVGSVLYFTKVIDANNYVLAPVATKL